MSNHLLNPWTLLKIEYAKFKSNAVINFLFWLMVILFPLVLVACKEIVNDLPPPFPGTSILYEFPTIWDWEGYVGNWLVFFFFGGVVIFTVTSEVSYKTQRQGIINGYTRQEYFLAKVLNITALSLLATIIYALTCIVIGTIFTEDTYLALIFDNNWAIARFFIMSMGYLSFALLIAIAFRRNGLAIFFYVAYALIFEYILRGLHAWFLHKALGYEPTEMQSIMYWPINVIEDNMYFPLFKLEDFISTDMPFHLLNDPLPAAGVSIIYICLFIGLAYRSFMKNDI